MQRKILGKIWATHVALLQLLMQSLTWSLQQMEGWLLTTLPRETAKRAASWGASEFSFDFGVSCMLALFLQRCWNDLDISVYFQYHQWSHLGKWPLPTTLSPWIALSICSNTVEPNSGRLLSRSVIFETREIWGISLLWSKLSRELTFEEHNSQGKSIRRSSLMRNV